MSDSMAHASGPAAEEIDSRVSSQAHYSYRMIGFSMQCTGTGTGTGTGRTGTGKSKRSNRRNHRNISLI
ncbi:hypothetical protein [Streptomyces sp. NPDC057557]|uniref:hypothetical protein n=1 Tax=Streptomyces sp. NPDC057557 TaxID=3346167 RepID=UPI003693E094